MTGCSDTETIWLLRIAGIFLGAILGYFYVHYAWYTRGPGNEDPRKHVKIKGLVIFSASTGVPALIGLKAESFQHLSFYMLPSGFLWIFVILTILLIAAYRSGLNSSIDPKEARRTAGKCLMEALFRGWPFVSEILDNQITSIHTTSKRALLQMSHDTNYLLENPVRTDNSVLDFRSSFKTIIGMVLYQFFQHSKDAHPDYCASYYKLSSDKQSFELASRVIGGGRYHTNGQSTLGKDSIAMKALTEGIPILYPKEKKDFGIKAPSPRLRNKKIKHFLVLPVPFDPNLDFLDRKGVLCIDTKKNDSWQLEDKFHVDLLEWCTTICNKLHQTHLTTEEE